MSNLYPDLGLTIFPQDIDNFPQWLDITAQDGPQIKQYMDAVESGNQALANQILAQIPSASQKIIKATDLNKISQALRAVERFYKTDVKDYIGKKETEWLEIINQFTYKGNWSKGVSYLKTNLVSYTIFGTEYIFAAIQDVPVGISPTNEEYWRQMTVEGQRGRSGEGLAYRSQWISSAEYNINDAVTFDGALWMAISPSRGVSPVEGSSSWRKVMNLTTTTYPIQDTPPLNQDVGELWFNTSGNPTNFYYLGILQNPATEADIALGKEAYDQYGNRILGTRE